MKTYKIERNQSKIVEKEIATTIDHKEHKMHGKKQYDGGKK
jgi:hypothetical protein